MTVIKNNWTGGSQSWRKVRVSSFLALLLRMSSVMRVVVAVMASVVMLAACQLALTVAPSSAFEGYGEPTFFGSAGAGNGQFTEPAGVAVNESNGDVYV